MRGLGTIVFGCVVLVVGVVIGGFLGVSGTTGPLADRQLFLFVDPYGQVEPNVTPKTQIHWLKLGGKDGQEIVPVQDIKFKAAPPCKEGNPEQGICTVNVTDGWHPYDCPDSCLDPTMPVGSRTRGGGGGGSGGSTGGMNIMPGPRSSSTVTAAFVMGPAADVPFGTRVKLAYFEFAGRFDDELHAIWSGDDQPVEPVFPAFHAPDRAPTFPSGPLARESVVCGADGTISVPADQTFFSGGASAVVPGVSVVWDSAGGIGSDWSIVDAVAGPGLKDVCDKAPPYAASAETAGTCRLKAGVAGSVQYQVLVKSGACASTTAHPVTLTIGAGTTPR